MKIYTYKSCGTCRKATRWLRARKIAFEEIPVRKTPPSLEELKAMLHYQNGKIRKLFNTAGGDYRALNLKERLPEMSNDEALELLTSRGNLVKRPFVLGEGFGLVGFKEAVWEELLASFLAG